MSFEDLVRKSRTPLFESLSEDDLASITRLVRRRQFASNQQVFARGDPAEELLVVALGRFRISVIAPDGRELAFRTVGPGEIIGEIAVLDEGVRTANMTATAPGEVFALGKASLARLISERPTFARSVIRFLCERLRSTTEQLESIALYRVEARTARFLLSLCGQAHGSPPSADISFTMTQGELAAMLGASRPKINGALSSLEEAQAIRRRGSRMTCFIEKLQAIAEDID